jgi:hypothetical protein
MPNLYRQALAQLAGSLADARLHDQAETVAPSITNLDSQAEAWIPATLMPCP